MMTKEKDSKNSKSLKGDCKDEKCQCVVCKGTEFVEMEDGRYRFCDCYYRKMSEKRIEKSGLKEVFDSFRFDNFIVGDESTRKAKQQAIEFAEKTDSSGLLVVGRSGSGKSHLCIAICSELIKKSKDVLFVNYLELVDSIKRYSLDQEERIKAMRKVQSVEVLYIDDLFKKKYSDADVAIIYEIMNHRNLSHKVTIITSEMDVKMLLSLDEATAGRIIEHCGLENIIKLETSNKRLHKIKK